MALLWKGGLQRVVNSRLRTLLAAPLPKNPLVLHYLKILVAHPLLAPLPVVRFRTICCSWLLVEAGSDAVSFESEEHAVIRMHEAKAVSTNMELDFANDEGRCILIFSFTG